MIPDEQPPSELSARVREYLSRMFRAAKTADREVYPWHNVGAVNKPPFGAFWSNAGGLLEVCSYQKDRDRVFLKGIVSYSSGGVGTVIFQLPAGYRPPATAYYPVLTTGAIAEVDIDSSGNVTLAVSGSPSGTASLSGITFRTV